MNKAVQLIRTMTMSDLVAYKQTISEQSDVIQEILYERGIPENNYKHVVECLDDEITHRLKLLLECYC